MRLQLRSFRSRLSTNSSRIEITWSILFAGFIGATYKSIPEIPCGLILASAVAILLLPAAPRLMRAADWSMGLLVAYEIPSVTLSQYWSNGVRTALIVAISALIYFTVRLTIRESRQTALLGGLLGTGGAWLAFAGLRQVIANAQRLGGVGLTDFVAFRSNLMSPPIPWVLGEWLTLLLLVLPFACALPVYLWWTKRGLLAVITLIAPLLIAATLTISLSRATFGSLVLFCVAACVLMALCQTISIRRSSLLLAASLGTLVLILTCIYPLYRGVFEAYAGKHTSQVRSGQGRIGIWSRSLELVRAHPLFGVGSSNAGLFLLSTADQEETTGFASRTFSLPVQVLVEKGGIGFLLYTTFLFIVGREFFLAVRSSRQRAAVIETAPSKRSSRRRKISMEPSVADQASAEVAMQCCFAAGLIAVLYRELTYSSVMEHALTLVLVTTLAALVCSPERA